MTAKPTQDGFQAALFHDAMEDPEGQGSVCQLLFSIRIRETRASDNVLCCCHFDFVLGEAEGRRGC